MFKQGRLIILLGVLLSACADQQSSQEAPPKSTEATFFQTEHKHAVLSDQVAVASAHPLATEAGLRVLENGGNAFDAAVAVSAALAVVEPAGSGFGGGGFWLLHRASDGKQVMIDGREQAPQAASRDMYLDAQGEVVKGASKQGPLAAGIPGLPAALAHINGEYGLLSLQDNLQPAYQYAQQGFAVTPRLQKYLDWRKTCFNESAKDVFLSDIVAEQQRVKQTDLAETIQRFANQGVRGFYQGETAERMVSDVQANGGIWTLQDLLDYKVIEREPVVFNYRDARIVSAAPPSSGGLVMQQTLGILEKRQPSSSALLDYHLITEAMRRAYRDRALYLGDADFTDIDQQGLTSDAYIAGLAKSIQLDQATPSAQLVAPNIFVPSEKGEDTTHFSIIDAQGNRVAATLSINFPFGSCFMPSGGKANEIAPGKRPLSSMSPTFIEQAHQVTVVGTPGGSRIISMVTLAILAVVDLQWSLQQVVDMPRFHHQFLPDAIQFEPDALDQNTQQQLQNKGHKLKVMNREYGDMHAVQWVQAEDSYTLEAASDRRGEGAAQVVWAE